MTMIMVVVVPMVMDMDRLFRVLLMLGNIRVVVVDASVLLVLLLVFLRW